MTFIGYRLKVNPKDKSAETKQGYVFITPLELLAFGLQTKPKEMSEEEVYVELFLSFIKTVRKDFKIVDISQYELQEEQTKKD